jgi:hypothetical protein
VDLWFGPEMSLKGSCAEGLVPSAAMRDEASERRLEHKRSDLIDELNPLVDS